MKQIAVIKFNHKKVNVNDFTIFCIRNTQCDLVDDIKDVVVNGSRYLFVVKAGHGFWDESIFDDCIAEMDIAVKGDENFESGIPESFNVLIKEIRALGLNIELN